MKSSITTNIATGNGTAKPYTVKPQNVVTQHGVHTWFTDDDTAITALVIDLEGTIDGQHWFQLARHTYDAGEITAKQADFYVTSAPVTNTRINITTLTGGDGATDTVNSIVVSK